MTSSEFGIRCEGEFQKVKAEATSCSVEWERFGSVDPLKFGFMRGADFGFRLATAEERARWPEQHFDATTQVKVP